MREDLKSREDQETIDHQFKGVKDLQMTGHLFRDSRDQRGLETHMAIKAGIALSQQAGLTMWIDRTTWQHSGPLRMVGVMRLQSGGSPMQGIE